MSNNDHKPMGEHEVDGISELDNLLPRWWVWMFWLCNAFAVAYIVYYHVLNLAPLQEKAYAEEMGLAKQAKAALVAAKVASAPQLDMTAPSTDEAILNKGKSIFGINCIACHATEGQGLIGPNLTDDFWIHGCEFANILNTITEGVPVKGMISWKLTMSPEDIHAVASFVWSIHGKDVSKAIPPPKPVEPEAKEYKRPS